MPILVERNAFVGGIRSDENRTDPMVGAGLGFHGFLLSIADDAGTP